MQDYSQGVYRLPAVERLMVFGRQKNDTCNISALIWPFGTSFALIGGVLAPAAPYWGALRVSFVRFFTNNFLIIKNKINYGRFVYQSRQFYFYGLKAPE